MMKSVDRGDYISRQQAIDKIKNATTITGMNKRTYRALNMVIKALESERPKIIRCKNCRHDNNCEIQYAAQAGSKFFCGSAERREP